jgi:beta-phosphoglucomutase-like phosphatase (HAD superfamily)
MDHHKALSGRYKDGYNNAILFDFNGTLCDDGPLLVQIYRRVAHEAGLSLPTSLIPMLMALSDYEIFSELLRISAFPPDDELVRALTERRRKLYMSSIVDSPPITEGRRQLIRNLASHVPLGVVSGAFHQEISTVLSASGLDDAFAAVVGIDDVTNGKPHPGGWLLGLTKINDLMALSIPPSHVLAIDDSTDGLRAARSAGMRTAAVANGVVPSPDAEAHLVLDTLDQESETAMLTILKLSAHHLNSAGRPLN